MTLEILAAFFATLASIPLIIAVCRWLNLYDRPGPLKIHARPTPRLGGISLLLGISAGIMASQPALSKAEWSALAAVLIVWFVGSLDDLCSISPVVRLAAQTLAAFVLWLGGWRIPMVSSGVATLLGLCALTVFFVNAFNFVDGVDGLAGTLALATAVSYLALGRTALTSFAVTLALSLAAACCAFFIFNFPPARIFFGDGGSTAAGILTAILALESFRTVQSTPAAFLFPIVATAIPLLDALRVVALRLAQRQSPVAGSRAHFYDSQLAKGWTPLQITMASGAVAVTCGLFGASVIRRNLPAQWLFAPLLISLVWVVMSARQKTGRKWKERKTAAIIARV